MERWTHIKITTHTDAVHRLEQMGAVGVTAIQEGGDLNTSRIVIDAYFLLDDNVGDRVFRIRRELNELKDYGLETSPSRVSMKLLETRNWVTDWRSFFPPRRFGDRLLITPSWEPIPDDAPEAVVTLDPGMAFGTGTHASTQLCLEIMTRLDLNGLKLADVGTGSGILAIAAIKLGAASVRAVDLDEKVIQVVDENATANGVRDRIDLSQGTIDDVSGTYNLLLMNILAKVIIPSMPQIRARIEGGGTAILSGITDNFEADDVEAALTAHGFKTIERIADDGWAAFHVEIAR